MEQREVRIVQRDSTYFVDYVQRRKHQRYSVAQFSVDAWSKEDIKEWLAINRPLLKLIDAP